VTRRMLLLLFVLGGSVVYGSTALAQDRWADGFSGAVGAFPLVLYVAEALTPDLRLELEPAARGTETALTLSWPLTWTLLHNEPDRREGNRALAFGLGLAVEPQYRTGRGTWRGVAGGRSWLLTPLFSDMNEVGIGVLGEGLAVLGQDGIGGAVGGGVVLGLGDHDIPFVLIALVYRRTWTDQGSRHDLCLDFSPGSWP